MVIHLVVKKITFPFSVLSCHSCLCHFKIMRNKMVNVDFLVFNLFKLSQVLSSNSIMVSFK